MVCVGSQAMEKAMPQPQPRFSPEEFGARGREIYERVVRPRLKPEDDYKYVAIDIESEAYEIDTCDRRATDRLFARNPDAQIWVTRAGQQWGDRLGMRSFLGGGG
jgi:hypothetical protein